MKTFISYATLLLISSIALSCRSSREHVKEINPLQEGITLFRQGKYADAEQFFNSRLIASQEMHDDLLHAQSLKWLGNVKQAYGKNDDALAMYVQSEKIIKSIILKYDTSKIELPHLVSEEHRNILNNQAIVFKNKAQYGEAITLHEKVLSKDREAKDRIAAAISLNNLGLVFYAEALDEIQKGVQKNADENFRKSRSYLFQSLDEDETPDAYANLGNLYAQEYAIAVQSATTLSQYQKQKLDSAVIFFMKAQRLNAQRGFKVNEALCYGHLGIMYLTLNKHAEAEDAFKKAIAIIEQLRGDLSSIDVRSSFISDKYYLYENLIELLVKENKVNDAFEYVERAKGRSFLDMIGNRTIGEGKKRTKEVEELITQEKYLQQRIANLVYEPDSSEVLVDLIEEHQSILNDLKKKDPEYASVKSIEPIKVEELQQMLDDSTALVEYYIGEITATVFVITRDTVLVKELKIESQSELEGRIENFRRRLFHFFPNEKIGKLREARLVKQLSIENAKKQWYQLKTDSSWVYNAMNLHAILVAPVESSLRNFTQLYIVPHGALHQLPFHALFGLRERPRNDYAHIPRPKFLIEKYAVSYLPSASVLKFARSKSTSNKSVALIIGDPLYADPKYRSQPLNGALIEADSVARYFSKPIILKREAAEESVVKIDIDSTSVVHFATHGELNKKEPLQSRILLAAAHPQGENDGSLTVAEVFNLNMHSSLVTLSACQSAQVSSGEGKINQGDELVGLTRSFLYAGTPSVIASLWYVDDAATLKFMNTFYSFWKKEQQTKVQAIRHAALQMLENPDDPDWIFPYYWAAFILVGDMQ